MTTQQLPPLPEPHSVLYVDENTGGYSEYQRPPVTLTESDVPAYTADQMRAYALAAISTRPVAESIHAENARTLQALVDELREMLGLDHGESLKEAVQRKVEQRDGLESMLKHSRRRNVQQLAESATLFSSLRRIAALSPTRFETHADMAAECQLIALTALEAYVAPIKKEQEA